MIALILILSISIPSMVYAIQSIEWPDEIERFEKYNTVFSGSMELGEDIEDAELPESLRGIVCIPDDMDVDTFTQAEPTIDTSTGTDYYDYYDYGYVKPSDAAEDYASGDLVIYSIFYASEDGSGDVGSIEYRIYGSLEGSSEVWFVCDIDGNITGAVIDIPVTWVNTGTELDNEVEGDYTFEAVISDESDYTYSGDMPTAVVSVYDVDSHDVGCDCDACLAVSTTTHESYYTETVATETASEDYGISTMALTDTDDYTYGTDDSGDALQMSDVISWYVTERISSSGNTSDSSGVPGTWIDYLNSTWLNVVGSVTTDGSETGWVSQCTWADEDTNETYDLDNLAGGLWTGTGMNDDFINSEAITHYDDGTRTWKVYSAEQLVYAMNYYKSGDTILLQNDIDLNGLNYNWEAVQMSYSVTIDGDDHTIYNLGCYISADYTSTTSAMESAFAYFDGTSQDYVIKDLYFDTGKIICDATIDAPEGADPESTGVDFAIFGWRNNTSTLDMDNVHVDNYLVISKASAVSVLIGMFDTATWSDTTGENLEGTELLRSINNCSVSNCWVYGHDHVGSIATYASDTAFTNCYAVGNTLIGTGYHSGSFVSCLNNRSTFDSCFAADNYMYSATQSGGFVGYAGDAADYTNCYASGVVEGYSYIGGFVGATRVGNDYIAATSTESDTTYDSTTGEYTTVTTAIVYDSNDAMASKSVTTTTTSDYTDTGEYTTVTIVYGYDSTGTLVSESDKTTTTTSGEITESATEITYSYAFSSRNYNTFTNCYSTTLVGMRTETQNSGGFVGVVAYMENYNPTDATVFDSCYAAGEVGSTQTVTTDNSNYVGGFVGYDQTYNNSYDEDGKYTTEYINCYYDKQTTAMREWVSGRFNSAYDEDDDELNDNEYDIAIMGVLTTDSEKFGTGLTSVPNTEVETHTEDVDKDASTVDPEYGFIGFTSDSDWVYTTEEHYPELAVFANATSDGWDNPELVKAYSLASTATVLLDTWDYGYTWDTDTGIRSDSKELYFGTYDGLDDHVADRYTYDTVREVVSNSSITDTATFEEMIEGGIKTQSYMYADIEYDTDKNITNKDDLDESSYNGDAAFDLDNDSDSLTVMAPGIDWYDITESSGDEVGSRPIRLISFMSVDAGYDQVLSADDLYDHKDDAYFTMIDTIKQNMIISLDTDTAWSTSVMQIYPETEAFHEVETVETNFTASSNAWINTEIWRGSLVGEALSMDDFVEIETDIYSYTEAVEGVENTTYYTIGQDGVFYYLIVDGEWQNGTDINTLTQVELYESEVYIGADGEEYFDLYAADYSVKIYGTDEDDTSNVTQAKWNGLIPLYPDLGETQYYIVRYYWVLGNGRYRSDYKILEIGEDEIDVGQEHDVTINVYNASDGSQNDTAMAVYADGYGVVSDSESESVSNSPDFATTPSSSSSTSDDGNTSVAYGEDSYVSWNTISDSMMVTKTVLTMTTNSSESPDGEDASGEGYVIGTVTLEGEIAVGDTITIPIENFYLAYEYAEDETTIIGQTTHSATTNVDYTVKEDSETGGLYLEFNNTFEDESKSIVFDDTSYNITFDIYVVEEGSITVKKEVENYEETMSDQSFIINLEGLDTQIALKDGETSLPIYTSAYDDNNQITFYVDETVPMEFALDSITYTINNGESLTYNPEEGITMTVGDDIAILVTNTYEGEAYFKDRDEEENTFTSSSDDE